MTLRPSHAFSIFFLGIALCSLLFIGAVGAGFPLINALIAGISPLFPLLFFLSPLTLLETLLIMRPSLDRISETTTIIIPFTENFSLSIAQGFGAMVVLLGILFFIQKRKSFWKMPLSLVFTILLLWGSLTLLYSENISRTLYELFRLFSIFFIFTFSYYLITNRQRFIRLLLAITLSTLIPVLTAWMQFFLGIGYTDVAFSVPRMYGTFTHPNIFALYLIIAMGAVLSLFVLLPDKKHRFLLFFPLGTLFLALIFTYARAAWGTFFIFIGIFTLFKYPKAIPFLIITPLVLFFASTTIQDRFSDAFNFSPSSSFVWRVNLWKDTIGKTLQENKEVFGYGLNTFEQVAEDLRGLRFVVNDPHSEFVRSFVEGGYIGFGIFLFFSLAPVWLLWKKRLFFSSQSPTRQTQQASDVFLLLWALVIALLLLSFTDHVLRSTMAQWILWAMIGGALGTYTTHPVFHKKKE
ncbi:MAG: O-antigen ligase family protein [Candidatus Moranbacteria bacterium]|nr:O-antigen ligase family protein [Candidatus Moranbacteria bacterium]